MPTELSQSELAEVKVQLMVALVGAVTVHVRGLRAAVTENDSLLLIAYFDRVPFRYEIESLQGAVAEAAYSLLSIKLEPAVRCAVTERKVLGVKELERFEELNFGRARCRFWAYARHGESPGDEDEAAVQQPLNPKEFTVLN